MGPIFHEKIPNYGSDSEPWKILKFLCVFVPKLQEMCIFLENSLNMGTYFW